MNEFGILVLESSTRRVFCFYCFFVLCFVVLSKVFVNEWLSNHPFLVLCVCVCNIYTFTREESERERDKDLNEKGKRGCVYFFFFSIF